MVNGSRIRRRSLHRDEVGKKHAREVRLQKTIAGRARGKFPNLQHNLARNPDDPRQRAQTPIPEKTLLQVVGNQTSIGEIAPQ